MSLRAVLRRVRRRLDDAMVARWSANPLGMLWPERDAAPIAAAGNGGGLPAAARRPVVIVAGS